MSEKNCIIIPEQQEPGTKENRPNNYRCRFGEIDLIARDNEYLVFIEVKYRKGSWSGRALEAVNFAKQKTICKVARYFLAVEYHNVDIPCRFDVVGIDDKKVYWVKNAFEYMN